MNSPKYTISAKAIDLLACIAERLGEVRGSGEIPDIVVDIYTDKLFKAESQRRPKRAI